MSGTGGFFQSGIGSDISAGTALKSKATALTTPLITYFYSTENKYFVFGHTEPQGVVIPMEIMGPGSPFRESTFTLADPSSPEIAVGDNVRVEWLPLDGAPSFQSPQYPVQNKEQYISVPVPDSEIQRLAGRTVEVVFYHLPQAGGARPSPSKRVYVAPELGLKPALEVEGVANGVLKAADFPDGITVSLLPIENMLACYGVEVLWSQPPDFWVERQRRLAINPKQEMKFHILPSVYQPHVGHRVTVKYFIYLGARLSPNFFWNTGSATEVSFEVV